ncbi:glycosyltransferase [Vagococcus fluvialis]|uniref:glycosyltransferase n=1 Tax=Vagococcus fluvialis TaxID=2738 RepID=UPI0037D12168
MRILILSDFELPDKSASAARTFEFAKIFSELNHDVEILGTNYGSLSDSYGTYESYQFKNMGGKCEGNLLTRRNNRMKKITEKLEKEIIQRQNETKIDIIFLVGYIWDYNFTIRKIAKRYNIKLISDVVEWYDKKSFSGLAGPIKFIQNRIGLIFLLKRNKNLVCISTLLQNYYKEKECNVIRIPTILDMKNYEKVSVSDNSKLIISYAGMPRKKDKLLNVIKSINLLTETEKESIELRIYGPTLEELELSGITKDILNLSSQSVICKGRIPKSEVFSELKKSDFTILLRPNLRYANAGFPTKVGESLAAGVPVITNITSDLSMYLDHLENSIIVKNDSPEECAKGLRTALNLTVTELELMKKKSYEDAYKYFDYHNYLDSMENFLKNIQ